MADCLFWDYLPSEDGRGLSGRLPNYHWPGNSWSRLRFCFWMFQCGTLELSNSISISGHCLHGTKLISRTWRNPFLPPEPKQKKKALLQCFSVLTYLSSNNSLSLFYSDQLKPTGLMWFFFPFTTLEQPSWHFYSQPPFSLTDRYQGSSYWPKTGSGEFGDSAR